MKTKKKIVRKTISHSVISYKLDEIKALVHKNSKDIEELKKQVEKMAEDIEKLKDKVRANGNYGQ